MNPFSARALFLSSAMLMVASAVQAETIDSELDIPSLPTRVEKQRAEPQALVRGSVGGQAGLMYRDNIYRSNTNEESDIIGYAAPSFRVVTDAENYTANVTGQVEGGYYTDNDENNYVDADLRGRGSYHVTQDTALIAQARARRDHIEIGGFVDDPNQRADEPTIYYYYEGVAGVETTLDEEDRVKLLADSQYRMFDYDNSGRLGGGTIIQDDRDRDEWYQRVRLGYVLEPGLMPYVEGVYNTRTYDERVDQTLLYSRDSDGYSTMAGVEYNTPDGAILADAAVGHMSQDYDAAVLPTINALAARAKVVWQVDPALRLLAGFDRSIEEAVLLGASGYVRNRISAGAEYMVAPLWTVGGNVRYTLYDFELNPTFPGAQARRDKLYNASAYVQYDVNEIYNVGLEYLYSQRDSNTQLFDFTANTVLLRVAADF